MPLLLFMGFWASIAWAAPDHRYTCDSLLLFGRDPAEIKDLKETPTIADEVARNGRALYARLRRRAKEATAAGKATFYYSEALPDLLLMVAHLNHLVDEP